MYNMTTDCDEIDTISYKAFLNINHDVSLARKLNDSARESSIRSNYTRGIARSFLNSGLLFHEEYQIEKAFEKLNQAHHMFLDMRDDIWGMIASFNSLGLVHIRMGQLEKAFSYLQQGLDLSREYNEEELESTALSYIGICQYKAEKFPQALEFFNRALEVNGINEQANILHNLGCTYRALKRDQKALEYQEKALMLSVEENRWSTQVVILEEIGLIYASLGNDSKSECTLKSALEKSSEYYRRSFVSINISLAELYLNQQRLDEAESYLTEALNCINESNIMENRMIYLIHSRLHEQKGNFDQALQSHKKYHSLQTQMISSKIDEKVWLIKTERLQKMNNRISSISKMGKSITSSLEREKLINSINECLTSLFDLTYCVIGELNRQTGSLSVQNCDMKCAGDSEIHFDINNPDNLFSWVARNKTGILMKDIENDYQSYLQEIDLSYFPETVRSAICLPFQVDRNLGILGIFSTELNSYGSEDRDLLNMLSSYIAIALNNTKQAELIRKYNDELKKQNKFDYLTEIYNRMEFLRLITERWKKGSRKNFSICLLMIDIDHFKIINDTWGHEAGDYCLMKMGHIFKGLLNRTTDIYARYGGEEFIVSLIGMSYDEYSIMAEKIREQIEKTPVIYNNQEIYMTISIGLTVVVPDHSTPAEDGIRILINEADRNLYLSKKGGRNKLTTSFFNLQEYRLAESS